MSFDAASFAIGRKSGGGGGTVEALSVTENGTYTAESGTAYSPVVVDVEVGVRRQTVTGTIDSPWGDIDPDELVTALSNGMAKATIAFTAGGVDWALDGQFYEGFASDLIGFGYIEADPLTPRYALVGYEAETYTWDSSVYSLDGTLGNQVDIDTDTATTLTVDWYTGSVDPIPSGTVTIASNGTHNVAAYAQAVVNVPTGGVNVVWDSGTLALGDTFDRTGMLAAFTTGRVMVVLFNGTVHGNITACSATRMTVFVGSEGASLAAANTVSLSGSNGAYTSATIGANVQGAIPSVTSYRVTVCTI